MDDPNGKIQAVIIKKISLFPDELATFQPFEVIRIRVSYTANEFDAEVAQETPCQCTLTPSERLKVSPFVLLDEE
jgi:hypothetical protein